MRQGEGEEQACEQLAKSLRLHPLVSRLLVSRGLHDPDAAQRFLAPRLTHLHDPALLPGAVRAAARIVRAVREHQPIVIYGDYDVDGVTASAILWHVLNALKADVHVYIPHRLEEGYGLNTQAVNELCNGRTRDHQGRAIELGAKPLIVSVDCGISAVEPATAARDGGVDLVITDHHEFDANDLPPAYALVHPRLTESGGGDPQPYPFGWLCGAGVAFKVAWQVLREHCGSERLPENHRTLLLDVLSLAALGTVADVMPLVDENRVLVRYGLGQIKRTRIEGLAAMIEEAGLHGERISAYHVGFVLGPRLNACGRMGHARDAVRLLTEARGAEARDIASFLNQENNRRRETERAIFAEARAMVEAAGLDQPHRRAIVLAKEGWHAGVVGIVASRLVEAFTRPAILLNIDGDEAHGSARSVDGVSMHRALDVCGEYLRSYGGHAMAAGLRLDAANIEPFRERFIEHVNGLLSPDDLTGTLDIDASADLSDVSVSLIEQLEQLAPFGRANPSPVFVAGGVTLAQPAQRVGREGSHLSMVLRQNGCTIRGIGFGLGDLAEVLPCGAEVDIAFRAKISMWQGLRRAELHILDVRFLPSG